MTTKVTRRRVKTWPWRSSRLALIDLKATTSSAGEPRGQRGAAKGARRLNMRPRSAAGAAFRPLAVSDQRQGGPFGPEGLRSSPCHPRWGL